ncbi:Zinc finger BED domain-containing protein DAYSLEEPER [Rhynchospora pubera]|uniref:Zinc finger BED domain-containing protein DAYSLEEPER n=1 Tax=Rhynchospora pubera TaxID=906938 RepID=A0AAV8CGS4_9POAL|nr:Zinc finger BED domain-containing protein DAYSLEEPER [Rhynchospora pubera]
MTTPQEVNELEAPEQAERIPTAEPVEEGQSGTVATPVPSWTENATSDQIEDLDTSKLRSSVWLHMHRKKINNEIKAVCNYCDAILAASSKSGTNHLHSHIKACLDKKKNEEDTTIAKFDQAECRKNLVEMVVLHEHPLSIVEQVGFKKFVNSLQPLFKIPSRTTVRCDIMRLYINRMKETMVMLDKNKGRVAITTDMWTADNQKKSYMASQHISWTIHGVYNSDF